MLTKNPRDRISSIENIMKHKWFDSLKLSNYKISGDIIDRLINFQKHNLVLRQF